MELLLYTACSWLPSHILAFYQYWDFKWRSKKFAILLVCLLLVIDTGGEIGGGGRI